MNENITSVTNEAAALTSVSQASVRSGKNCLKNIIDLTEINDNDECETTSTCSVIVSNNRHQPDNNHARSKRRKHSNSSENIPSSEARSESKDDSICILYEKIQPAPDIEVVSEVIIDQNGENESVSNISLSYPIPPIIMGSYTESSYPEFQQIPPFFSEISSERSSSSSHSRHFNLHAALETHLQNPHHSSLPSCKYATRHRIASPPISVVAPLTVAPQRNPLPRTEEPLHSKNLADNVLSQESNSELSNIETPKIQCGICLDGPDEIAASRRNFTSTKCGHVFCDVCIKTALKTAAKCPKCRKKVTSKQIFPLYF